MSEPTEIQSREELVEIVKVFGGQFEDIIEELGLSTEGGKKTAVALLVTTHLAIAPYILESEPAIYFNLNSLAANLKSSMGEFPFREMLEGIIDSDIAANLILLWGMKIGDEQIENMFAERLRESKLYESGIRFPIYLEDKGKD